MHCSTWLHALVVAAGVAGVAGDSRLETNQPDSLPEFQVVPKDGGGHRIVKAPAKEQSKPRDRSHELVKRGLLPYLSCRGFNYKMQDGQQCMFEQKAGECRPETSRQAYQLICWGCTNLEQFDKQKLTPGACADDEFCVEYVPNQGSGKLTTQVRCVKTQRPKAYTFVAKTHNFRLDTMTCSDEYTIPKSDQTIDATVNVYNEDGTEFATPRMIDFVVNDEIKQTNENTDVGDYGDTLTLGDKLRACVTTVGRVGQVLFITWAVVLLPEEIAAL